MIIHDRETVLLNSIQEFIQIEAWLFLILYVNTIKFYALHCHVLKNKDV